MQKSEAKHKRFNTDSYVVIFEFSYYPLLWMFHSRKINSNINRIQEHVLRIVHKETDSDFSELLTRDNPIYYARKKPT